MATEDLKPLAAELGELATNFNNLVTELNEEKFYRNEARKRTWWQRAIAALLVLLAIIFILGFQYANSRVIRSIRDCTQAPKHPHTDPKKLSCYERGLAQQGAAFGQLRNQEDALIRQRNQELLTAVNARQRTINFAPLPPIIINVPTAGTGTTQPTRTASTTTTTSKSPSTTGPPSSSTTTTSSTTCTTVDNSGVKLCH